ncbi:hypothetical protein HXY32_03760 [Candidatus Bathyarchaeota archaeon]|nr:hypothetical protein [Candidatus Bathyarchaeota archaeon]
MVCGSSRHAAQRLINLAISQGYLEEVEQKAVFEKIERMAERKENVESKYWRTVT